MWKEIGTPCEWKHTRTTSVRLLWDGRASWEAVLEFLCTKRVRCVVVERAPTEDEVGEDSKGEEGTSGPPKTVFFFFRLSLVPLFFWCKKLGALSFVSFFCLFFGVLGGPTMTG